MAAASFAGKCCNKFSHFYVASANVFASKTCLEHPRCINLLPKGPSCNRYVHSERKFYNVLKRGVEQTSSLSCELLKCRRFIHISRIGSGIEEFFPPGVLETPQPLPEEVKSGRSWRAAELRQKSNEDLHKLWYTLLKERNMLLTVHEEARRVEVVMPSPERLHKVKKSMAMIKVVLHERERAIQSILARYGETEEILSESGDNNIQVGKHTAATDISEHVLPVSS